MKKYSLPDNLPPSELVTLHGLRRYLARVGRDPFEAHLHSFNQIIWFRSGKLFERSDYGIFKHLYTGKIVDIHRKVVGGFDVGAAVIESVGTDEPPMTLSIKNEFLVATIGDRVVASVPDLITMVDHETSSPINSERVHYGQRVTVFGIGCPPHYRSEKALNVVAPRNFGFDFDFVPIEKL